MNKRTTALTTEQYREIITTMKEGGAGFRPNERVATALVLEGNLGIRISDIVRLHLSDIVMDGNRYRLSITEQKTGKQRVFTVPLVIYQYMENYCLRNGIDRNALMFPLTTRAIQKQLALVCEFSLIVATENTLSCLCFQRFNSFLFFKLCGICAEIVWKIRSPKFKSLQKYQKGAVKKVPKKRRTLPSESTWRRSPFLVQFL